MPHNQHGSNPNPIPILLPLKTTLEIKHTKAIHVSALTADSKHVMLDNTVCISGKCYLPWWYSRVAQMVTLETMNKGLTQIASIQVNQPRPCPLEKHQSAWHWYMLHFAWWEWFWTASNSLGLKLLTFLWAALIYLSLMMLESTNVSNTDYEKFGMFGC